MFGKKKESRRPRPVGDLEQYGIFEVPDINIDNIGNNMIEDDNDEDLEAELAALTAGNDTGYKSRRNITRKAVNLDEMVAESMKDTISDEESTEGDDDPALLKELQMLTGNKIVTEETEMPEIMEEKQQAKPNDESTTEENNSMQEMIKVLQERLTIYEIAEQKARKENESGKAKRFSRGVRTLKEMLVSLQSGRNINEADIPPLLPPSATTESTIKNTVNEILSPTEELHVTEPSATSDVVSNDGLSEPTADVTVDQEALNKLKEQQQKYKTAALAWKKAGNKEQALQYVKTVKQFDIVIAAVAAGEKLDLSDMPPTPTLPSSADIIPPVVKEESEIQQQASTDTGI